MATWETSAELDPEACGVQCGGSGDQELLDLGIKVSDLHFLSRQGDRMIPGLSVFLSRCKNCDQNRSPRRGGGGHSGTPY